MTEKDLHGHIEAYHSKNHWNTPGYRETIFFCDDCDNDFQNEADLQDHILKEHPKREDHSCDKCDYAGKSSADVEQHRLTVHYYFKYTCGACDYETLNKEGLRYHKAQNHRGKIFQTSQVKVTPPPRCNPGDALHTSECCDRDPKDKRVVYLY